MKKILIIGIAVGLLAFAVNSARAQFDGEFGAVTANIKVSGFVQGEENEEDENGNFSSAVHTIKITTQDILARIEEVTGIDIIKGDRLVLVDGGFEVWDSDDDVIVSQDDLDLAGIEFTSDGGDSVLTKVKGHEDEDSSKAKGTAYLITTITFDDGRGNAFTITGISQATFSLSQDFDNGTFNAKISISINGSGEALIDGDDAVVNGTATGKGKFTEQAG